MCFSRSSKNRARKGAETPAPADYDVIVIGAGALGCAVARALSRYDLRIAVLEKNSDVAGETTGRNSAVVHAGFNNRPGSRMARFCVEGNEGFEEACRELDVPCRRTGKLVVAFNDDDLQSLERLLAQGQENGCRGLRILEGEELEQLLRERGMESRYRAALWSPNTAITNPFLYCVALAENARANGVDFFLDTEVTGIKRCSAEDADHRGGSDRCARFVVTAEGAGDHAAGRALHCRYLINCAGLQADRIAAMAGMPPETYRIYPCRGEYCILDKMPAGSASADGDSSAGNPAGECPLLPLPVYPAPQKKSGGLGVHLTPTIEGNIIIGPSAEYLEEPAAGKPAEGSAASGSLADGRAYPEYGFRADYACTRPVMDELMRQAKQLMPEVTALQPIGNYAGVRPKQAPPGEGGYYDFVIRAEDEVPGLIDLIGIESPGLTASLPIAREVCRMIDQLERNAVGSGKAGTRSCVGLQRNADFCGSRQGILRFREQTPEKQQELIEGDPAYGEIICRCQQITRREICQAIENPLGAKTISAIKYRAWATTGRCNGGYCLPRIVRILMDEYGLKPEEIRYRNRGSEMFTGKVK